MLNAPKNVVIFFYSSVLVIAYTVRNRLLESARSRARALLGGRRKFEAARFGNLLRSDNLQYILVLNSETKFHDALLGISRNLVF